MTLQEVWSLLNLYNSSFSGEQIDEAIGVILNGGISAAVEAAQQSADAAAKSASEAAGSAASVGAAATNAQSAASRASGSATEAESYAHGGTGTREGEDEDNARYYAALAQQAAGKAAEDAVADAENRLTQYVQDAEDAKNAAEDAAQSLNSAEIDAAGHLILTAPDGSTRDLGDVTGEDGSSIQSITRTAGNGAPGTTDTYTVTLTDGSTTQFQVYNGTDGSGSGDMTAAVYDPQGKAQDIFKYVDDAIGKIPTPDVSGQINTHNEDPTAHAAIRASLNNAYNKVISMGEQLVVNGTGFMGNNTNFSWWDFDGSQGNGSPASFTKAKKIGGMAGLDELIPVNATKPYEWKLDLKSEKGISTFYTFVQCYDADMLEINSYNVRFRDGSTTKLAKDLVAGDSVLHLEDVSGWLASMNGYTDAIIWNYKNSFGYAYPKETYSRTKLPLLVSGGNITIDTVNKTVTLKNAYTGETIPAGTDLSQGTPGHSYRYYPLSNVTIPTVWTSYSGVLEGTDIFFRGTAYVRLKMFWNDNYADDRQWMTNVSFREWRDGVTTEEMNTAIANATANLATKDHTQAASTITAGTLGGEVSANSSGQTVGNSVLRNSKLVSADTTPTVNGEIYWTYE